MLHPAGRPKGGSMLREGVKNRRRLPRLTVHRNETKVPLATDLGTH